MVTMFNPKPQLLRAVDKPDNVSSQEIAKARPVYIDGLTDVEVLQDLLEDFDSRIEALETALD